MDKATLAAALHSERDGLASSPDRPAKDRRLGEIDEQLGELEDTADRSPRERAVRGRKTEA